MSSGSIRTCVAIALLCVAAPNLWAQESGAVGGRVVDAATGEPVVGVVVEVDGEEGTLTDARGIFILLGIAVGPHDLTFSHLAYGTHSRQILVEEDGELALDVAISTVAIELAPMVVEARSELDFRRTSSGHSINEIQLAEIELAHRSGLNLSELLQSAMPGVSVRQGFGAQVCVTYRAIRSDNDRGDCDGVAVMLDGVPVADPSYLYTSIPLSDIQRLEIMSPGQGGVRYGMRSGQSVLLVETKRGEARRRGDLSRLLTGFAWDEETEPYRWLKVFGSAFLANGAGVGIGLAMADRCFRTPPDATSFALRTQCRGAATAGASVLSVVLPAVGGSMAARWGGQTDRSRGRMVPSMVMSGMILTGGYLMLIGGEGATQTAGAVVLSLAVPLTMTFSDRIFRVLRLP